MAPHDKSGFSLRWEFVPNIEGADRAIRWRWKAFTQAGEIFSTSEQSFDSFTECVENAKNNGYRPPS